MEKYHSFIKLTITVVVFIAMGSAAMTQNVGIGISSPLSRLHIAGGSDASFTPTSGFLMLGNITGSNIVFDNNEILARNNGLASELYLNIDSGDVMVAANGQGNLRIGANGASSQLWLNRNPGLAVFDMSGGLGNTILSEGDFRIGNATQRLKMGVYTEGVLAGQARIFASGTNARLILGTNTTDVIGITPANGGTVVIGDVNGVTSGASSYKLSVRGKIACTELMVKAVAAWPDYVFDPAYALLPLPSLKTFIDKNRHLPGIPNAKTMDTNGIMVGDIQTRLLQKIEELTLYIIQQDERLMKQEVIIQQMINKDHK